MPAQSIFRYEKERIREIDLKPPLIYGDNSTGIQRIKSTLLVSDSTHHDNLSVRSAYYAKSIQRIIILDQLSPRIRFYDLECRFLFEKLPQKDVNNRDQIIMNIAWSERQ